MPSSVPKLSFQLYILESMDLLNTLQNKQPGTLLEKAADLAGLPVSRYQVPNRIILQGLLKYIELTHNKNSSVPIIHISCHGDGTGIRLFSEEDMSWMDLAAILRPINHAVGGTLILALSSCFGARGRMMAYENSELPCFALVGPKREVYIPEAAVAWSIFYYHLQRLRESSNLPTIVNQMNVAMGRAPENGFEVTGAHHMKKRLQELFVRRWTQAGKLAARKATASR